MSPSPALVRSAIRVARLISRAARRSTGPRGGGGTPPAPSGTGTTRRGAPGGAPEGPHHGDYDGDYDGIPQIEYSPVRDGEPDPGEVVWAWVPYEEDHTQGKDRPVLIIGRDDDALLALQMTSKDHDTAPEEADRHGRQWVDMGSGSWDSKGRESMARTDRILRLDPAHVRRVGAILDRDRFDAVTAAVQARADGQAHAD